MTKNFNFLILPMSVFLYGISWALIFLTFSAFHGMTEMFNDDFVFLIARIFNFNMNSIQAGFTFAFFDGALFGLIIGTLILLISKKNKV
jgi:hypothetical protein